MIIVIILGSVPITVETRLRSNLESNSKNNTDYEKLQDKVDIVRTLLISLKGTTDEILSNSSFT